MTDKNATEEDLNMVYFQDVYDSPAKSDTSSVDIYDGLDISSIPAEPPVLSTPTKDCLDLYEEILTEEVTAKEASFNDLHAEYEKCQKQMKELVNRLKEMQTQNTTLQNENQCLKKNISAVIKTARVEINRKEDEINRLNQRLFSSVNPRVNKHIPVPLSEPNKTSCHLESRSNRTQPKNMDSCGKSELQKHTVHPKRNDSTQSNYQPTEKDLNAGGKNSSGSSKPSCAKLFKISETDLEIQPKNMDSCGKSELQKHTVHPKRNDSTHLSYQTTEKELNAGGKNSSGSSKPSCAKLFKISETDLEKKCTEGYLNQDAAKGRKERNVECQSKDSERKQRKEECKSSSSSSASEKKIVELKENGPTSNSVTMDSGLENQATKFDLLNERNRKSLSSASHDKACSMRDRAQSKEDPRTKEKLRKPYESYSRRDSKDYDKGKGSEHRSRPTEKEDPPRRSQRASHLKDEGSYKVKTELNDHRRSSDTSRREKHSSDYNKDSKSGYRDSKLISGSKNEHKMSSKKEDQHLLNRKSVKSSRDKKDESKGSKEKEHKKKKKKKKKNKKKK
uniref:LOC100145118 protein n=1 Tax=Xenopus tropicalis TaxID=8364 RepID=B0JYV2_XENTR|nr:LOC100145118 protein [Xenopus tropicalis]|eukprot:NP_001120101.1 CASP8-associated protein 2 [Xenopus tropicalis]